VGARLRATSFRQEIQGTDVSGRISREDIARRARSHENEAQKKAGIAPGLSCP